MDILIRPITTILSSTVIVLLLISGISAFSLAFAYTAQYVFGLEPCILCLYQRVPFAIAIFLGLTGLFFRNTSPPASLICIGLSAPVFLANAVIAFYHTGVEQKWWKSAFEACRINFDTSNENLLESILKAPTARCDEIPWSDPILNLSMANYNIALSLGMAVLCILSIVFIKNLKNP